MKVAVAALTTVGIIPSGDAVHHSRLCAVLIDCRAPNVDEAAEFWAEALGREVGFALEGSDGPFTVLRAGPEFQLQLAAWGTPGLEHYAFSVSKREVQDIFERVKSCGIAFGPTFDSVGLNTSSGQESGARGIAPIPYFNDPNKHLIEIRTYER